MTPFAAYALGLVTGVAAFAFPVALVGLYKLYTRRYRGQDVPEMFEPSTRQSKAKKDDFRDRFGPLIDLRMHRVNYEVSGEREERVVHVAHYREGWRAVSVDGGDYWSMRSPEVFVLPNEEQQRLRELWNVSFANMLLPPESSDEGQQVVGAEGLLDGLL